MNPNLIALFQSLFPVNPSRLSGSDDPLLFLSSDRSNAMEAIVDEPIFPGRTGRVWFQASWWDARCEKNVVIPQNAVVYVIGRRNITLLVEPVEQQQRQVPCVGDQVLEVGC